MIDFETARPLKGYEGQYLIDENGNIYSLPRHKEISPHFSVDGYKKVALTLHNKTKHYLVHRLVAETLIDNPNNYPIINHKDENKTNNNVSNLEWCTYSYNICYRDANKRRSNALKGRVAHNRRGVYARKLDELEWVYYPSIDAARKGTGVMNYHVSAVCAGKEKQTRGYVFRYAEQSEEDNG